MYVDQWAGQSVTMTVTPGYAQQEQEKRHLHDNSSTLSHSLKNPGMDPSCHEFSARTIEDPTRVPHPYTVSSSAPEKPRDWRREV